MKIIKNFFIRLGYSISLIILFFGMIILYILSYILSPIWWLLTGNFLPDYVLDLIEYLEDNYKLDI